MWKRLVSICLALTATLSPATRAGDNVGWHDCFTQAAARYRIAPDILIAIASAESALDPSAVHINANGSSDMGLMQVNSRWLPALREAGINPQSLYEPCTSIWVGAWILAQSIARHGYGWEAVGAYNAGHGRDAGTVRRRMRYAHRVFDHLHLLPSKQRLHDSADDITLVTAGNPPAANNTDHPDIRR